MAGSKPGERRGGREKGTPNKRTEELYERAQESGKPMPADMLLALAQDAFERWQQHRDPLTGICAIPTGENDADGKPLVIDWGKRAVAYAGDAAPYYHPTMKSIEAPNASKNGGLIVAWLSK